MIELFSILIIGAMLLLRIISSTYHDWDCIPPVRDWIWDVDERP